ncbi:ABC transporter permease [Clostridium sp. KNHs216]|uniref:ABC transporter permease n=1 Tax=Clostridium sp. KNHs216 TaxID=1550235 RepID=UPI00115274F3|nr:ABC transporter permease [Clostridium sp. KNHs216]TQI66596.1 ribose transport system permease protein [Clostridium sp. KNHs216]
MKRKVLSAVFKYSQLVILIVILIILSLTSKEFLTWDNISNVVMQQMPFMLIISMGMTLAILTKGIDLSIASNLALSSCVAAYFIKDGKVFLGILAAVVIGALVGAVNGMLITKARLEPFIATYTMDMVVRGLAYLFMSGTLFYGFSAGFCSIATGSVGPVSNLLIVSLLLFAVLFFALRKTTYGRSVYAIGCNINATRLSGINTGGVVFSIYVINGLLAAVTGLLYIARLNAAESTIGSDFTMQMMAATLIGGTSFSGGKGGIERTLLGVLIMVFIANGMNLNGVSSLLQDAVFGVFIVISLVIDKFGSKYSANL